VIRNQGTEMEGVEMRIGMDASVEANGPKEESEARTCGLGCGRIVSSSEIEVTAQPRTWRIN